MSNNLLYISMNGMGNTVYAQAVNSNNLANVSTPGFKADLVNMSNLAVEDNTGSVTDYNNLTNTYSDLSHGSLMTTERELDVAVDGEGWFAVQASDGTEAYTRAGAFHLDGNGQLVTSTGRPVLGNGGPIAVPPSDSVAFGSDGTISLKPSGQAATALVTLDRLKLVNPDKKLLVKGEDGLFRLKNGSQATADSDVKVVSGALESSNVSAVSSLVNIINLSRNFEVQSKLFKLAETDGQLAAQLLQT